MIHLNKDWRGIFLYLVSQKIYSQQKQLNKKKSVTFKDNITTSLGKVCSLSALNFGLKMGGRGYAAQPWCKPKFQACASKFRYEKLVQHFLDRGLERS